MDKALFTAVRKDLYFELWLKYYSQFFEDIYVVDTDPDSPDLIIKEAQKKFKFTVVNDYPNPGWSMQIDHEQMKEFQKKLLEKYLWVLFAHADEFIFPDPDKYKDLSDYIASCQKDYVFCNGYEVFQMYDKDEEENELPLDLNKPILKQRKWWNQSFSYCKPLLSKVPLEWNQGFHNLKGVNYDDLKTLKEPDLYLAHLKVADYAIFNKRIAGGLSGGKGEDWFYQKHQEQKELIPERFKEVF